MDTLSKKLANPFAKKEVPLPGERIAVITDPTLVDVDPAEAARPIQLPPPQANASWSEPGGSPSNNLGHLVLNDQLRKVWSADAGTGIVVERTLERGAAGRRRQGVHARCRGHRVGLLLGQRREAVDARA